MRALRLTIVLLGIGGIGAGCGDDGSSGAHCGPGILLLSWTIKGQPPTADQGCRGVDTLGVELHSDCSVVTVDPIPCINGARWEYDQLPGGENFVILSALDSKQNVLAQGTVMTTLDATVPAMPVPIDLE